ncbi:MAG: hypothetical protein M3071_16100 [Actinomycetota bacterium]|nr:hypothetical protein [Actinomycetota bacterium]
MIGEPPLITRPEMWADFALLIVPSAALTISFGDFASIPLPDDDPPPQAEIAQAASSEQAAHAAIRHLIGAEPNLNEL